ncbi:hypothetical protein [Pedobacter xixiisoli]|uniref:Uncharacterized protein n=1 Tax=Pedobacter xixiisoli TaxID=1476464 RepID=A0A285ZW44_9SPHI|nr:hypothetical protein [Pedobacter xixiisoli]SOD13860.1 hypothetical protein SAMN06297358_1279 [Pedobacter xixiisoli]
MFNKLFKQAKPTKLSQFLQEVFHNQKDPFSTLGINTEKLRKASFEQLLDNPGDIAEGVNKVQMDFSNTYFTYFGDLVIKTYDDGMSRWMFYDNITDANIVIKIFNDIKKELGAGMIHDEKFATFNQLDKIKALSMGKYSSKGDEILHLWQNSKTTVKLNYQLEPLRRLVLSFNFYPEKKKSTTVRNKGTLIGMMKNDLRLLILESEICAIPTEEKGRIKFIDYTYRLQPIELNIFDRVDIRLFSESKFMDEEHHANITYWSTKSVEVEDVILLVDQLARIYGTDNHNDKELKPHEVEMIENGESWTGRTWDFNNNHQLIDYHDDSQNYLYNLRLDFQPEDRGLKVSVIFYHKMLGHHLEHFC